MRLARLVATVPFVVSLAACTDRQIPAARDTVGSSAAGAVEVADTSSPGPGRAAPSPPPAVASPSPDRATADRVDVIGLDWSLEALDGAVIAVPSGGTSPTLRIDLIDGGPTAVGNAGCNRFRGTVTLTGTALRFGPLLSTRMACPALDLERRYTAALESARTYRVMGKSLELLAGDRVVARFSTP